MSRLRHRPLQAAAIALLAALVTACAAFAPLYDRAMQQSLTDVVIDDADPATTGLQLSATRADVDRFEAGGRASLMSPEILADMVPAAAREHYRAPILQYDANVTRNPAERTDPTGPLVWREDQCDHLRMVSGACPVRAGEIAVSPADVDHFGLTVGTRLSVAGLLDAGSWRVKATSAALEVVGVYRQIPGDYWFGVNLTGRSGLADPAPGSPIGHDVWLTGLKTFTSPGPPLPNGASRADLVLDDEHVGVDDVHALGGMIDRLAETANQGATQQSIDVRSGLPGIADEVEKQTSQSRVTVPLLMAQLGLLGLVVLWLVLLAATEQRRPEAALARLRGRGRRGARALLLGELLPAVLAGVVPGILIAVLGSWVARAVELPGRAPFELGRRFAVAVILAVAVLVVLAFVAVSRVAREPVETLLRRVPVRRAGWSLGVVDALVIAGSGGVVVVFMSGGLGGPIALVAPGLLAVVVGLTLAHLATPTAAVVGRRLLRRGRMRAGVSALDAARSPATRRTVAIVTLATALAVFSADALAVGDRNRADAAAQEAGAPVVAQVDGDDLVGVRAALAEVDPDAEDVTPVVRLRPPGVDASDVLAVDPDGFRKVALFPGGASASGPWTQLRGPSADPIRLRGTHVEVDAVDSTLRSVRPDGHSASVTIGADVSVDDTGETLHTSLGVLEHPTDRRRLAADVGCRDGCHLTAIWVSTLPGASIKGAVSLADLRADTPVAIGPASGWSELDDSGTGSMRPASDRPDRLRVRIDSSGAPTLSMSQKWLPGVLPALVAGPLPPDSKGERFDTVGLDGQERAARRVATLAQVPASGPDTIVVGLDAAARGTIIAPDATTIEVWFGSDDPTLVADVTAALGKRGIAVSSTRSLSDVRRHLDDSAPAWSLQLAALVGGASLLIALLVLLVGAASSWRVRSRDLAALRMSGVGRRAIDLMAVATQLPAVILGVVAGAAAGLYGAHLALPIVPLLAAEPEVSTLDLSTAWGAALAAAVAALVFLGVGSVLIGRAVAGRAELRRLRETM